MRLCPPLRSYVVSWWAVFGGAWWRLPVRFRYPPCGECDMDKRLCAVCGEVAVEVGRNRQRKYCPPCKRLVHARHVRNWMAAHPERNRDLQNGWYQANRANNPTYREQVRLRSAEWRSRDRAIETGKVYFDVFVLAVAKFSGEYGRDWRAVPDGLVLPPGMEAVCRYVGCDGRWNIVTLGALSEARREMVRRLRMKESPRYEDAR